MVRDVNLSIATDDVESILHNRLGGHASDADRVALALLALENVVFRGLLGDLARHNDWPALRDALLLQESGGAFANLGAAVAKVRALAEEPLHREAGS